MAGTRKRKAAEIEATTHASAPTANTSPSARNNRLGLSSNAHELGHAGSASEDMPTDEPGNKKRKVEKRKVEKSRTPTLDHPPGTRPLPKPASDDTDETNSQTGNIQDSGRVMGGITIGKPSSKATIQSVNNTIGALLQSAAKAVAHGESWDDSKSPKPELKEGFVEIDLTGINVPVCHPSWGIIPYPGPDGPVARPELPSARASYATTIPPLWEDQGVRFKTGRYQPSQHGSSHGTDEDLYVDSQDHIVVKLMDMRPSKDDPSQPRRQLAFYQCKGVPRDWNSRRLIKAMNDRKFQAIQRMTLYPRWYQIEREYLAELCNDYPDASILELAERFNYRFKGDLLESTSFDCFDVHQGRTTEDIRHEYLKHKEEYDAGKQVPTDSRLDVALAPQMKEVFAKAENKMQKFQDDADGTEPKLPTKRTRKSKAEAGSPAVKTDESNKVTKGKRCPQHRSQRVNTKSAKAQAMLEQVAYEAAAGYDTPGAIPGNSKASLGKSAYVLQNPPRRGFKNNSTAYYHESHVTYESHEVVPEEQYVEIDEGEVILYNLGKKFEEKKEEKAAIATFVQLVMGEEKMEDIVYNGDTPSTVDMTSDDDSSSWETDVGGSDDDEML